MLGPLPLRVIISQLFNFIGLSSCEGVFFFFGGDGGEEEVFLKNAPLIFNREIRKAIPEPLFGIIHLHAKYSIAFSYCQMFNFCVCVHAPLSNWPKMSSLTVSSWLKQTKRGAPCLLPELLSAGDEHTANVHDRSDLPQEGKVSGSDLAIFTDWHSRKRHASPAG